MGVCAAALEPRRGIASRVANVSAAGVGTKLRLIACTWQKLRAGGDQAKLAGGVASSNSLSARGHRVFYARKPTFVMPSIVNRCQGSLLLMVCLACIPSVGVLAQARPRTPPAVPATATPRAPSAPLVGTISDQAGSVAPVSATGTRAIDRNSPTRIRTRPLGPALYIPLAVQDAPVYNRGGSTLSVAPVSSPVVIEPEFFPTAERPVWRLVAEERPVQGWRLVDVDDVICYASGGCRTVTTRVVARWIPTLRGYGFRDRLGRQWQVE